MQTKHTKEANQEFKPQLAMMEYFKPVSVSDPLRSEKSMSPSKESEPVLKKVKLHEESLEDQSKIVLKSGDEEQVLGRKAVQTSTESGCLSASIEKKSKLEKVKERSLTPSQNVSKGEDEDMDEEMDQSHSPIVFNSKCNLN